MSSAISIMIVKLISTVKRASRPQSSLVDPQPDTSPRAEALRCLLLRPGREHGTAEIASLTGLSRVGVHQALDAMARAGACEMRQKGRKDLTWWVDESRWWDLLRVEPADRPCLVDWPSVYRGLIRLLRWLLAPQRENESSYLRASRARELVETISPLLSDRGLPAFFVFSGDLRGERFWPSFELGVRAMIAFLESGPFRADEPLAGTHPVFIQRFLKRRFPWIADVDVYAAPYQLYYRLTPSATSPMEPDLERVRAAIEPFRSVALRVDVGLEPPPLPLEPTEFPEELESVLMRSDPTLNGVIETLNKIFPRGRFVGIKEDFGTKTFVVQQAGKGERMPHDAVVRAFGWLLPWSPFRVQVAQRSDA